MTLRHWQDLTTVDFEGLDPERSVAVMPLGAIEQHGPHLPVSTDAVIAEEMAKRALERVPDDIPALLMPTMAVGKSNEHLAYPGTLTLSAKTLIDLWFEVAEGVKRAGLCQGPVRQRPWRPAPGDGDRRPRAAGPPRPARGVVELVAYGPAGGSGGCRRGAPRHPWRDGGNLHHAASPARSGPDGPGGELRLGAAGDRGGQPTACAMWAVWGSAGRPRTCTRPGWPAMPARRRRRSARRWWTMSPRGWPIWWPRCRGIRCRR